MRVSPCTTILLCLLSRFLSFTRSLFFLAIFLTFLLNSLSLSHSLTHSFYPFLSPRFTSFLSQFLTFPHFVRSCHSALPMVKHSNTFWRNSVSHIRQISKNAADLLDEKTSCSWKSRKIHGRIQSGRLLMEKEARCRTRFAQYRVFLVRIVSLRT